MLSCRDHLSPGISLHTSKLSITILAKEKEILAKAKEIDILKGNNYTAETEINRQIASIVRDFEALNILSSSLHRGCGLCTSLCKTLKSS